jgi:eukaryotic-like serine/threonine-protein kinase
MSPGRDVKAVAGLTLARAGEISRAKSLAEELKRKYPNNTMLKLYWLPTINAAIELDQRNSSLAVSDLEAATSYELGSPSPMQVGTQWLPTSPAQRGVSGFPDSLERC